MPLEVLNAVGGIVEATADIPDIGRAERDRFQSVPGEIVLILRRSDGRIWLHTKEFYPDGAYRVATGKLHDGESPDDGFRRELREETGLDGSVANCVGLVNYCESAESFPFTSHFYVVEHVDEIPEPEDASEAITGWKAVDDDEFQAATAHLRTLDGTWGEWGRFRAIGHDMIQLLKERNRL